MNKNKFKETLLFIVKSAVLLKLAYLIHDIADVLGIFVPLALNLILFFLPFPSDNLASFVVRAFETYFYVIPMYFIAKKLGIIKTLDKSPLFIVIIILTIYELVLTFSLPINVNKESWDLYLIHKYKLIISNTFTSIKYGYGFIYVFISYKFFRFLVNKYPKLSWLKKFYPQKFETIITFKNFKKYTYDIIKTLILKLIKWFKENYRPY